MLKRVLVLLLLMSAWSPTVSGVSSIQEKEFLAYAQGWIEGGGDVDQAYIDESTLQQTTLLVEAARCGYKNVVEYLLEHHACISAVDSNQNTALHYAVLVGDRALVQLLIDCGADVNAQNSCKYTPLHNVCTVRIKHVALDMATLLIKKHADVNAQDDEGMTPLHHAIIAQAKNGTIKKTIIQLLIDAGACILQKDDFGNTSLHQAVSEGTFEITQLLLAGVEDPNVKDDQGNTLLHKACVLRDAQKIQALIARGADMALRNNRGQTPFMSFLGGGTLFYFDHDIIPYSQLGEFLLADEHTDINARDKHGNNLLHYAVSCDSSSLRHAMVAQLIRSGHHLINAGNNYHQTPLYDSLMQGYIATTIMLLRAGAHTIIYDKKGITPLGYVIRSKALGDEKKRALARIVMLYGGVLKKCLKKVAHQAPINLDTMKNPHRYGINTTFIKEVLNLDDIYAWNHRMITAYFQQEYGIHNASSMVQLLRHREMTSTWKPRMIR